jgi:hypothetical protein
VLMPSVLITVALIAALPFEARSLDGTTIAGELTSLSRSEAVLQSDAGPVTLPLAKLASLMPASPGETPAESAGIWIELRDGSRLPAAAYEVANAKARIRGLTENPSVIPTSAIYWVRFGRTADEEPNLAQQWSDITKIEAAGDLLVVHKDEALDYLEGVVRDIDAEICKFELDGEEIPVKRSKIAGIIYAHHGGAEPAAPIGKLVMADGSQLEFREIELKHDQLEVQTTAGTRHKLLLGDVLRFDFSFGKVAFLSDLEPESVTFTPLVGFEQPPQGLLSFYEYRRDMGFEKSPLRLDGKMFRKGLALATRTELVYKLPDKFRLFRSTVGIDDSTREAGSVRLSIKGDGKVLWEGDVRGTDPSQELELNVAGVRRLEILADYGEGLDVGDRLDLGDAQVTK